MKKMTTILIVLFIIMLIISGLHPLAASSYYGNDNRTQFQFEYTGKEIKISITDMRVRNNNI